MKKILFVLGLIMSVGVSGQCWKDVSVGYSHNLVMKSDRTLWGWGWNIYAQLGNGTSTFTVNAPSKISNNYKWKCLTGGIYVTMGVKTDGTLWGWGSVQNCQLGDGTPNWSIVTFTTPIKIGIDTNWEMVSCGHSFSTGIKTDGTLWSWGFNQYGGLGNGLFVSTVPIKVNLDSDWAKVSSHIDAYHAVMLKRNGTLWSWGENTKGEVGDGTTNSHTTPIKIGTDTNWSIIETGLNYTIAKKKNGTLWAWGSNNYGQLGLGDNTDRLSPIRIGSDSNWQSVSAGTFHTVAVKTNGTLWAWGKGDNGELGDGTLQDKNVPTQIGVANNWQIAKAGGEHSIAININGTLSAWGRNYRGEIGDGTTIPRNSPVKIICNPLPLKLLSFTAKLQPTPNPYNEENVLLQWQTTNEINVSHINIQRSINGKDFTTIDKVNAVCCEYHYIDNKLPTTQDKLTLYYRLEIIDKDGSKKYSEITRVKLNDKQETRNIVIYPNPATAIVTIECANAKELLITDYLGKIIKQFSNPVASQIVNTKQLPKGLYIVKAVTNNGQMLTAKLVVQ